MGKDAPPFPMGLSLGKDSAASGLGVCVTPLSLPIFPSHCLNTHEDSAHQDKDTFQVWGVSGCIQDPTPLKPSSTLLLISVLKGARGIGDV